MTFEQLFIEISSWACNWQKVIIGSGNDLVPNMQQSITWANAGQNISYHMESLGHNELNLELWDYDTSNLILHW